MIPVNVGKGAFKLLRFILKINVGGDGTIFVNLKRLGKILYRLKHL